MNRILFTTALVGLIVTTTIAPIGAQESAARPASVDKALEWLKTQGQAADGTFSVEAGPGVTALVLTAMLRHGLTLDDPSVAKGFRALETFVKADGGVYGNGRLKNYETCVAVLAFSEANRAAGDKRYDSLLANAKNFLTAMQYGAVEGESPEDPAYGGAGYSGKGRPDLSNTAYLLEALRALDAPADDPAVQRALVFVSRCQNLKSEHNTSPISARVDDGGFFYKIPTEEELESGDRGAPEGGLRSYGSMSYSGLKSMIYAGLTPKDQRVSAATAWIAKHYSLTENPGMGKAGLYYYFHTFGAALKATGQSELVDANGAKHAWRDELRTQLAANQQADGSWKNDNPQWFEEDKNLCTAFALLALAC